MDIRRPTADALSQPTRAQLFQILSELRRGAGTEELAALTGLHPNGVRAHLEALSTAGLLDRARQRQARGRPRDVWTISPTATPGGEPPTGYAELGQWLVRAIASATDAVDVEAVGREIGRGLPAEDDGTSADQQMHTVLAALGFQPSRRRSDDGELTYCLGNCPYREVVRERQPVVCGLHRGITRGLLDTIDEQTELVGFVPEDPDKAGCQITVRGPMADRPTFTQRH
jgi:predicted ArsR family transcriptional regulator